MTYEKNRNYANQGLNLNGNMTEDKNRGLELVTYNYLNLPETLLGSGQTIEYIYDANGQKVAKKAPDGTMTYYAGSFVYEGSSLKYILHGEGKVDMGGAIPKYQY